ncbi:hypothetical protein FXF69_14430 [Actinomadura chibensis]|uniref:ATP-grasp ribosomal peptide maturase n=2 Tax=Actinomadura chibensis TaxID=392828 RepID=A0A5D0NQB3_9ACTN|nr:hypothetical protein FXF69_14430 [Actinomadura chibensis]
MVIAALNRRGVQVVRIDPADIDPESGPDGAATSGSGLRFAARIGGGDGGWDGTLRTASRELDLGRVRAVYHRRPGRWRYRGLPDRIRRFAVAEARHGLAGLIAALPVPHVNPPAATARAEYKPEQLRAAADLGFAVPPTLITNDLAGARRFAADHAPVVYKTFRGVPSSDGETGAIWTQRVGPDELDESIAAAPHLFQAEIQNKTDARVTVVGDRVHAHLVRAPGAPLDWRAGDWNQLTYEPVGVPEPIRQTLYRYLDLFGLVFGCFDFAVDERGRWHWIECNPSGQWGFLPDAEDIADSFAALLQAG